MCEDVNVQLSFLIPNNGSFFSVAPPHKHTRLNPHEDNMTRDNRRYKYAIYNLYLTKTVSLSELSDGRQGVGGATTVTYKYSATSLAKKITKPTEITLGERFVGGGGLRF